MSEKPAGCARKADRRVQRTRDGLGDALIELILEKPYDAITVQEVLDRAGVSRSTFYTHYRDKNDLFVSDVDEGLRGMAMRLVKRNEASDRVAPVREFFGHVEQMRHLYAALVASGKLQDFLDLAQGHFARGIERRLATLPGRRGIPAAERPALASALAGSLLALLVWWMRRGTPGSAEEMDTLFHRLVWSGVRPRHSHHGEKPDPDPHRARVSPGAPKGESVPRCRLAKRGFSGLLAAEAARSCSRRASLDERAASKR